MSRMWFYILILMPFTQVSASGLDATEIQMFVHYRARNVYEQKIVSTPQNPVSAFYVYEFVNDEPLAAACYRGKPEKALRLFSTMVGVFNAEYNRRLQIEGYPILDLTSGEIDLRIFGLDEKGQRFSWFEHMNPCVRPSTHTERWP